MRRIRSWLVRLLLRDDLADLQREIEEEFRFHKEMKAEALVRKGMDPSAARAVAEDCFGDTPTLLEAGIVDLSGVRRRETRRARLEWFRQDLRDGFRRLGKSPGFSLLAIGTLALGLSTSSAVFTYVNAYRQSFPGADADGVHQLFLNSDSRSYSALSYLDFLDLQSAGSDLFDLAGAWPGAIAASVRYEAHTEVLYGQAVTGRFFSLLGVEVSLGRGISREDDLTESPPVVVISHRYWVRHFASDPNVLGTTIYLNNRPHTLVGVASSTFLGSDSVFRPEFWLPFEQFKMVYWGGSRTETDRDANVVRPYLRHHPGVEHGIVGEFLASHSTSLDREAPLASGKRRLLLEPATWIQPAVREAELPIARVMFGAAVVLLLLACANVANLFLSAGTRRSREMALRSAMGASRIRLIRQLLVENLLLSLTSGVLALAVAGPAARRLSSYLARPAVWDILVEREIVVDLRVLGFGVILAIFVGLLAGILPAFSSSRSDLAATLNTGGSRFSGGGSPRGGGHFSSRDLLVSAQVALSVVLLVLAGLVLRTLENIRNTDPGFDAERTLASYVSTSSLGIPRDELELFFRDLISRFEDLEWVRAASVAERALLTDHLTAEVRLPGLDAPVTAHMARVIPGYFEALGMDIILGRSIQDGDTVPLGEVVVVNEALANLLGEQENILGQRLTIDPGSISFGEEQTVRLVGVVEDVRLTAFPAEPGPAFFLSLSQQRFPQGAAFLLRVFGDPSEAARLMEEQLHAIDSRIAIVNVIPYSEVVAGFLYPRRMNAELFSVIALIGLILAAAGVFGVMSLAVARQKREIGIRLAIGADPWDVVRLVGFRVFLLVLLGLVVGAACALAGTRLVEGLLWGVQPNDPLALALGIALLLGAAVFSAAIPIGRALRVDPVQTLLPD